MKNDTEGPRYFTNCELRVSEGPNGKPRITGYAAVFNSRSNDLGGFIEEIAPGAFAESLAANDEVLALVEHDPKMPLGRRSVGTVGLKEDSHGLLADIDPPDTTVGRDAVENVRSKVYKGMSFRFGRGAKDSWRMENGTPVRTIHKCSLRDVTVTAFPAYEGTSVSLRSVETDDELRSYYQQQIKGLTPAPDLSQIRLAEKRLKLLGGEVRATMQYDDPSLVYHCRDAIALCRAAFDRLQGVVDMASKVMGGMSVADKQAADDCISTIIDLIGKAKLARTELQKLGAKDDNSGAAA